MANPFKVIKNLKKLNSFLRKSASDPESITDDELKEIYDLAQKYGIKDDQAKAMLKNFKKVSENDIISDDKGNVILKKWQK
jgi:hypothetical protein